MKNLVSLLFIMIALASCSISRNIPIQHTWIDVAVIEEEEVFVDTSNIKRSEDGYRYAWVKTIYPTEAARNKYVQNIRNSYKNINEKELDKKMAKWDNFSYNISYRIYDCQNKRFKTTEVTDYSADKKPIITSIPSKNNTWKNVDVETMGDYTLYFICDYEN